MMFYDIENISPNVKDTFDEIVDSVIIHRIHLTKTTTTTISSNKITPFTNSGTIWPNQSPPNTNEHSAENDAKNRVQ